MALSVNSNIQALNAYRNLSATQGTLSKSLEKLSSGLRINRAADDAAGLAISEGLRAQIGGLQQASKNAQDGISVVQTAEGALNESHSILQRLRTLAVQAANGSNDPTSLSAINAEATALKSELTRISDTSSFNNVSLLNGGDYKTGVTFQVGYKTTGDGNTITATIDSGTAAVTASTYASLTGGTASGNSIDFSASNLVITYKVDGGALQTFTYAANFSTAGAAVTTLASIGASIAAALAAATGLTSNYSVTFATDKFVFEDKTGTKGSAASNLEIVSVSAGTSGFTTGLTATKVTGADLVVAGSFNAGGLGLGSLDLSTSSAASTAITAIDDAIKKVSSARASLGALQNRFERAVSNLNVTAENLAASESRIRDTDMAEEMVKFTRTQILSQAGTAMLAQAKNLPQSILSLLQN